MTTELLPTQRTVSFFVAGDAQPAGSKKAYVVDGRARVVDANKNAGPWKERVALTADGAMLSLRARKFFEPVYVQMTFRRRRPASHYRTDGVSLSVTGRRYPFPSYAPDVLKLARAVEDALTDVVYEDDALIVSESLRKEWAARPEDAGVHVMVMALGDALEAISHSC